MPRLLAQVQSPNGTVASTSTGHLQVETNFQKMKSTLAVLACCLVAASYAQMPGMMPGGMGSMLPMLMAGRGGMGENMGLMMMLMSQMQQGGGGGMGSMLPMMLAMRNGGGSEMMPLMMMMMNQQNGGGGGGMLSNPMMMPLMMQGGDAMMRMLPLLMMSQGGQGGGSGAPMDPTAGGGSASPMGGMTPLLLSGAMGA
ncbi:hypothetical protein BsWGS_04051 [Bradybaena similaris]